MIKYINKILNILKKYNYEFLDEYENKNIYKLKIEYTGEDLIYKDRYIDFNNKYEYWEFANKQANLIYDNFEKALKELKKKGLTKQIIDWEWDYEDYPCIYITFKII